VCVCVCVYEQHFAESQTCRMLRCILASVLRCILASNRWLQDKICVCGDNVLFLES